jgi:ribosomal-protein-alanine N-acetyltransferase
MPMEIRGRRVWLRRFTEADIPAMLRLVADPLFHAAVEEMGSDEQGIPAYLSERSGVADFEVGKAFDLAVELPDGPLIGLVTLVRRLADQGEIGYALHADYRGLGYATEAARLLVDHVFGVLGFHRTYIWLRAGNTASEAVARRLGFRLEGTMVEAADMADPRDDVLHFGMLRREWHQCR